MNFRKAKVSKAALLVAGLLVVPSSPQLLMQRATVVGAAALAYAEPPPIAAGLAVGARGGHAKAAGTCANVRRELRFEMITAESTPYPPTWRNPAVCLAVYVPGQ